MGAFYFVEVFMGDSTQQADMELVLGSVTQDIKWGGKVYTIAPANTGQLFSLISMVSGVQPLIDESKKLFNDSKLEATAKIDTFGILSLILDYKQPIYGLIKLFVNETDEVIDSWPIDITVEVLATIVKLNKDFFVHRLTGRLGELAVAMSLSFQQKEKQK